MSEAASKLRANVALSIVQKQLDLIHIEQKINKIKFESTTWKVLDWKALDNNVFKPILEVGNEISVLVQDLRSLIPKTCSAISASIYPSNCSMEVTSMIKDLDIAIKFLVEAESKISTFRQKDNWGDWETNNSILTCTREYIILAMKTIKKILDQLHNLIFGEGKNNGGNDTAHLKNFR
jgi:hypothetical protein